MGEAAAIPAELAEASSARLTWLRFKRHKLALWSAGFLVVLYVVVGLCEFFAPYDPNWRNPRAIFAPPPEIHFFDHEGR